jgi:Spherulation-specific family 4
MTAPNRHRKPRERSPWLRPGVITIGVVVLLAAAGAITASLMANASGTNPSSSSSHHPPSSSAATVASCHENLVVPAYFYNGGIWAQATASKHAPQDMILDVSGMGAGTAPDQHYVTLVNKARKAGIAILGYISTVNGQRPLNEVESELYNYKTWYGVTSIFFDRVSGQPQDLAYYTTIANIVHQQTRGAVVWFNPGVYPDRRYMSIADVVMAFEGTYQQYVSAPIPGWARRYPAAKFAHTVYGASASDLGNTLRLASKRNAKYVYVTDGNGNNPYAQLPSYWAQEDATAASCQAG